MIYSATEGKILGMTELIIIYLLFLLLFKIIYTRKPFTSVIFKYPSANVSYAHFMYFSSQVDF